MQACKPQTLKPLLCFILSSSTPTKPWLSDPAPQSCPLSVNCSK